MKRREWNRSFFLRPAVSLARSLSRDLIIRSPGIVIVWELVNIRRFSLWRTRGAGVYGRYQGTRVYCYISVCLRVVDCWSLSY